MLASQGQKIQTMNCNMYVLKKELRISGSEAEQAESLGKSSVEIAAVPTNLFLIKKKINSAA